MRLNMWTLTATGIIAAGLVVSALAQGGPGKRPNAGAGYGMRMGAEQGGWWNKVTPRTPEETAFVKQVTAIHEAIRTANRDMMALKANNGTAAQIAVKEAQLRVLRADLAKVTSENKPLLKSLGLPDGMGVCDGTGLKGSGMGTCGFIGQGRGMGQGKGLGQGMGMGRRGGGQGQGMGRRGGGPGTNPNCPFVK